MIRPIQVGDYVSKQWLPGVFFRVVRIFRARGEDYALIGNNRGEYWAHATRRLMRAVPLRQPSTHAAHAMGSGGR